MDDGSDLIDKRQASKIERAEEKLDAPSLEAMAERHKQAGNEAFKERDYVQASVSYMQGIEALKAAGYMD